MLGLFSRSRRKSPPAKAGSFRPTLELLESRDCPSTLYFNASVHPNTTMVTFQGYVTNAPNVAGLTVQLSGVANGTATTDANGNFSVTLQASGLGTETAATTDGQSNTPQITLVDPASTIDHYYWIHESGSVYTFMGHVTGGYQGEVITLGGIKDLEGKTATVDANGNFEISVQLDGQQDDNGDATALATDAWGTTSNLAWTWVMQ